MTKRLLLPASLALLAFLAGFYFGRGGPPTAHAQDLQEYSIGGSWGALRGSVGNRLLLFEDADGNVRIVDLADFHPTTKMLRIERILKRQ